jgi:hypothetical protein
MSPLRVRSKSIDTADKIDVLTGKPFTRWELLDRGDIVAFPFWRPCRVKILMVVDASISFNRAYFGLSHVLDVLRNNPEFFVKFEVTRAHRETDLFKPDPNAEPIASARYGPHFEGFRFTQAGFNINDYDQVWLFGFRGEGHPTSLSPAELEVIARWMDRDDDPDAAGGLFTVGDHADLGAALCSAVPRARSIAQVDGGPGRPAGQRADPQGHAPEGSQRGVHVRRRVG